MASTGESRLTPASTARRMSPSVIVPTSFRAASVTSTMPFALRSMQAITSRSVQPGATQTSFREAWRGMLMRVSAR